MTMMMMMRQTGLTTVRSLVPTRAIVSHQRVLERSQSVMCVKGRVLLKMDLR